MSQLQDKLEFAIVLAEEMARSRVSPFAAADLARSLMRAAKRYHALCERKCNGYQPRAIGALLLNDGGQARDEKASKAIEARVTKALAPYGITARFNGDPRGAAIKLVLPRTKRNNDFGGEGYCVPQ
jgi:hypothetical protein